MLNHAKKIITDPLLRNMQAYEISIGKHFKIYHLFGIRKSKFFIRDFFHFKQLWIKVGALVYVNKDIMKSDTRIFFPYGYIQR